MGGLVNCFNLTTFLHSASTTKADTKADVTAFSCSIFGALQMIQYKKWPVLACPEPRGHKTDRLSLQEQSIDKHSALLSATILPACPYTSSPSTNTLFYSELPAVHVQCIAHRTLGAMFQRETCSGCFFPWNSNATMYKMLFKKKETFAMQRSMHETL